MTSHGETNQRRSLDASLVRKAEFDALPAGLPRPDRYPDAVPRADAAWLAGAPAGCAPSPTGISAAAPTSPHVAAVRGPDALTCRSITRHNPPNFPQRPGRLAGGASAQGAIIAENIDTTVWQPHTVRGSGPRAEPSVGAEDPGVELARAEHRAARDLRLAGLLQRPSIPWSTPIGGLEAGGGVLLGAAYAERRLRPA
jgi:hypothetical protein